MTSIRKRLVVPIVGGLFALAVISGTILYLFARHILTSHFDSALVAKARALATLVEQDDAGNINMEFSDENMPEFLSRESPRYFQVWRPDDTVLKGSTNLKGKNLKKFGGPPDAPRVASVILPGGMPGRAVGLRFYPLIERNEVRFQPHGDKLKKATVVVARDRRELDDTLLFLLCVIMIGAVLLPLIAAVIVMAAVRWSLRPVDDLSMAMEKVHALSPDEKFSVAAMPTELQPVVQQLNELMARLNAAFERERRFTMNASHELRTPLAEARTALEVALKWPDDKDHVVASCGMALESAKNMQGLIDALLSLARVDSAPIKPLTSSLDLHQILESSWSAMATKAAARNIVLSIIPANQECRISSDPALLSSVIANLLENAVEYALPGTEIIVTCDTGPQTVVQIENVMQDMLSEDDLAKMFQPLWRKEVSRTSVATATTGETHHSGLGLALVNAFCRVLNVDVQPLLVSPDKFAIKLIFPPGENRTR